MLGGQVRRIALPRRTVSPFATRTFTSPRILRSHDNSKGHIYATSSGLFKLTLPLIPTHPVSSAEGPTSSAAPPETAQHWDKNSSEDTGDSEQVNFLLHPRQPLSYLSGLISAETAHTHSPSSPPESSTTAMVAQSVTFHGCGDLASQRWSSATELGDFVRDSSKTSEFVIRLTPSKASSEGDEGQRREIKVQVPSFEERTWHLRHRLRTVSGEMEGLLKIKSECDRLARAGAKRFAVGGLVGMGVWWFCVYWFTFRVQSYGWDVMEPVTYLVGLTAVMGGYLWFIWNQREVSYAAAFDLTKSRQREALYAVKGFDREAFHELTEEGAQLRRAIKRIATEYGHEWHVHDELDQTKPRGGEKRPADIIRARAEQVEPAKKGDKKEDEEEDDESIEHTPREERKKEHRAK